VRTKACPVSCEGANAFALTGFRIYTHSKVRKVCVASRFRQLYVRLPAPATNFADEGLCSPSFTNNRLSRREICMRIPAWRALELYKRPRGSRDGSGR